MNIPFSLLLDGFVAVLLIVTIGYALTLNSRLGTLRKDKEELQRLALSFGESTARAEVSIAELGVSIDVLQERIKRAESLREDLVFLVERGNGTADTLEELVRTARDKVGVMPAHISGEQATEPLEPKDTPDLSSSLGPSSSTNAIATDSVGDDTTSEAERELIRALRSAR